MWGASGSSASQPDVSAVAAWERDWRPGPLPPEEGAVEGEFRQPSGGINRDKNWWVRKSLPWALYGSPDNPRVEIVRNKAGQPVEVRSYIEPCAGLDCPGFVLEHRGPGGAWVNGRECPYHGFKWQRNKLSSDERRQDLEGRLYAACIPGRMRNWTFYTFPRQDGPVWQLCMDYANAGVPQGMSLLLIGSYGTGKTGLAISILRKRIEEHAGRGLFVNVADLFEEMKALFGKEGETSAFLQRVTNVPLLVLDDMGAEKSGTWVETQLYYLLNARVTQGRPTIVTTNLALEDLVGHLGQRTVERLKPPWYRIVEVEGPNLRDVA